MGSVQAKKAKNMDCPNLFENLYNEKQEQTDDTVQEEKLPAFFKSERENLSQLFRPFNGKGSVIYWINHFEDVADLHELNPKARLIYAKDLMRGTAKSFIQTINVKTWDELKKELINAFVKSSTEVKQDLKERQKRKNESFQEYLIEMKRIASTGTINEEELILYVIHGIHDSKSNKILLYNAKTMSELEEAIKMYERMKNHSKNDYKRKTCFHCKQPGHKKVDCPKLKPIEKGSSIHHHDNVETRQTEKNRNSNDLTEYPAINYFIQILIMIYRFLCSPENNNSVRNSNTPVPL